MNVSGFSGVAELVDTIDVERYERGATHRVALRLVEDRLGNPVHVPVMILRGANPGPVFGVTAAVHGDELNGIRIIQQLAQRIDLAALTGTLVVCPVVNVPAFLQGQRLMREGFDLNRIMPGRPDGNIAQVYAHRLMTRLLQHLDYLVDLHTASFGRANSLYVRANLKHKVARRMAILQAPDIIVNNEAADGTVRGAAMDIGIPAITVEAGNPLRFQKTMIRDSTSGLIQVLAEVGMVEPTPNAVPLDAPVICDRSYWLYASEGGLLVVLPQVADLVKKGDLVARVSNVFGDVLNEHVAPEDGVVVGLSTNPLCETGSRILHLGVAIRA